MIYPAPTPSRRRYSTAPLHPVPASITNHTSEAELHANLCLVALACALGCLLAGTDVRALRLPNEAPTSICEYLDGDLTRFALPLTDALRICAPATGELVSRLLAHNGTELGRMLRVLWA